ncbi:MAG: adenylate/guanylate cyclase domain-containing protein [Alsobacter sp.]
MSAADPLMAVLRQSVEPAVADALDALLRDGKDHELNRINALALAEERGLDPEATLGGLLHASRLGLFELSWNVLCPGCGGVLGHGATLKTLDRSAYHCALCSAGYEPTLDEMVEVTFTVSPRIRRIPAHDPHSLPMWDYARQVFWSTGTDLPQDNFEALVQEMILDAIELPPGEKAVLSVQLPEAFVILFEPVTHTTQFLDISGEPTRDKQALSLVFNEVGAAKGTVNLRPGPLRLSLENHTRTRALAAMFIAGDALHELLGRRRPFVTAKRLLSNQTFRDLYRAATMDVNQRLKITSMTFLFTDLKGSTALYDQVGDIAAFDLVRSHFARLLDIVSATGGAVVKTIGDAVMATFPDPAQAMTAALQMRRSMDDLNRERGRDDILLNIGLHEGPCLAVMLDERQDYFGQTVNVAARVQDLAQSRSIFTTGQVLEQRAVADVLRAEGIEPIPHQAVLRGVSAAVSLFEIP